MQNSFVQFFEYSSVPMWVYALDTLRFLKVNSAAIEQYGYSESEFLNLTLMDIRPAEDVYKLHLSIADLPRGFADTGNWRHILKSGELRHVHITSCGMTFDGRKARLVMAVDITERVRALELAQALNERSLLLSEATGDAHWDWNINTGVLHWTGNSSSVLGTEGQTLPANLEWWKSNIYPEDRESVCRELDRFLQSSETLFHAEYRWVRGDGTILEVQDRGRVVRDAEGNPTRMVGAIQDISSRRQAERLGNRMFAVTPDLMLVVDSQGCFTAVSDSCERVLGYQRSELLGKEFMEFVLEEDRERTVQEWGRVLDGSIVQSFENRYVSKSGAEVWLQWATSFDEISGQSFCVARDVTWRRASEAQMHLLQLVSENTSDIVIITEAEPIDPPGPRIIYVNPAFTKITEYTEAEALGDNPRRLQGPKTDRAALARIKDGLRNWRPVRQELLNYTKSGQEIWLDLSIEPVSDSNGRYTHWISIERDVTERKRQEAELLKSRETMTRVINSLRDALVSLDLDWRFTYVNNIALDLLGAGAADPIGRHVLDVLPTLAETPVLKWIEDAVSNGKFATFEVLLPSVDRWFELRIYPHDDGVSIYFTDIDDRRKTERERSRMTAELRQMIRHLNAVSDQSLDVICSTDLAGRFLSVSRASIALWGYTEEMLIGREAFQLVVHEDRAKTLRAIATLRRGLDVRNFENRIVTASQDVIEMMWSVRLDKELGLAVCVGRDVTEINKTRRELERSLVQAQELVQRAEAGQRAQKQFMQNMSHELRTPMNGILGIGQLLQMTRLNSEQKQFADIIIQSGESLLVILNEILDLSAIETGRIDIRREPFVPVEVARSTVELFRGAARRKGLIVDLDLAPGSWATVTGDAFRLKQVLSNLVGNAVKFTKEGYVRVTVNLTRESGNGLLRIEVKDTGIGIPENAQDAVFQPFFQADMSTTRSYGGTGLGLAISKSLVEAMGGEIGFETEIGVGTTFWISLPVILSETSDIDSFRAHGSLVRPVVLVVEDEPLNVDVLRLWLDQKGFLTEIAPNAFKALEMMEQSKYDIVLMDLHMPGMDGFVALERLRKLDADKLRWTPVIAVTAAASSEDRERCLGAGFDGFVPKPVLYVELEKAMRPFVNFVLG